MALSLVWEQHVCTTVSAAVHCPRRRDQYRASHSLLPSHSWLPMIHTMSPEITGVEWLQVCWNDILVTPGINQPLWDSSPLLKGSCKQPN